MKYLKQFMYIALFSFIGELLNKIIPLSVPASIYGMLLLFAALYLKIIKLDQVQETAEFLLSIMIIMFVPAGVGIMDAYFEYKSAMLPIAIIIVVSTIITMTVTGLSAQFTTKLLKKERLSLPTSSKIDNSEN